MRSFTHWLLLGVLIGILPYAGFSNPQISSFSSTIILKGIIVDVENNNPLPYVSIGILNKPLGTLSDSTGHYQFEIGEENRQDTLQVSMIGYVTQQILIAGLLNKLNEPIRMQRKITILEEVFVSNKEFKTEVIGKQRSGKFIQVSIHNKKSVEETIGSEMGMKFNANKKDALLKDFNWNLSGNNFNHIKFRVNVYALKNGYPDSLLCKEQIFATVENFKTGWFNIDLEPYHIKVSGDFLITVQWVESKKEKPGNFVTMVPVSMTPFSKNCYVRIASQDKWKKMGVKLSAYITVLY
ncbi:MAG: carboxypeptidase-like regulatory domain-containing protein [Chitinophagaceae bacterium]